MEQQQAAAQPQDVVNMVDYLRETIEEIDSMIAGMQTKRTALAIRLAAIEASEDASLAEAAQDYGRRVEAGDPYEEAEPAEDLIRDAHARFGTP